MDEPRRAGKTMATLLAANAVVTLASAGPNTPGPRALAAHPEWSWVPEPGKRKHVLSRGQVAWALANAYLTPGPPWGACLDWSRLYGDKQPSVAGERLRCLFDYFARVERECNMNAPIEYEWVTRHPDDDVYPCSLMRVDHVDVHAERMETDNPAALVDFSNSKLHVHNMIASMTQEELIFSTHSECFLGLALFPDEMGDDDCIVMRGVWRHVDYTDYPHTFRYAGPVSGYTDVIAMDALPGGQWGMGVERDLRKAHLGFSSVSARCISTGNWGCGAFGGHPLLKLLQQTLGAQWAGKRLRYSTFGDEQQAHRFRALLARIAEVPGVKWVWMVDLLNAYMGEQDFEVYLRGALMIKELRE